MLEVGSVAVFGIAYARKLFVEAAIRHEYFRLVGHRRYAPFFRKACPERTERTAVIYDEIGKIFLAAGRYAHDFVFLYYKAVHGA